MGAIIAMFLSLSTPAPAADLKAPTYRAGETDKFGTYSKSYYESRASRMRMNYEQYDAKGKRK